MTENVLSLWILKIMTVSKQKGGMYMKQDTLE